MSYRHKLAAIKEKANSTLKETIVGQSARLVAKSVLRQMETNDELAVVYLKRTPRQGWPGHFLPAVGVLVEQMLHAEGNELQYDASASKDASQIPTSHGYGNLAVPGWRKDFLGLVFASPALPMAEVIQLHPKPTEVATLRAA